jgi:hypothetical protein
MKSRIFKILLVFLFGAAFIAGSAFAEGEGGNKNKQLNKPTGQPIRAYMNINNISTVIKNAGTSDIDVFESNAGLVFPKGSAKTAIFESGLVWGAMIEGDPQVRVGGSTYREGVQPGAILSDGTVEATDAPHVRIYRVRPEVFPGAPALDLSMEATDEGKSESEVRAQYETDWLEWPAEFGAPYEDVDGDGTYSPTVDIPGFPGADQTIWYVANDQNAAKTTNLYGTNPLGIEMQVTFWAYAQTGALGNMFFRKYKLINKTDVLPGGPQTFNDMYVSMWSDPDIGNSTDDFAGSDTVLSLSYSYNANAIDAVYNPLPPPAIGFDFFQGPIVPSPGDTAIFNGELRPGFKNLPMTASYYYARGDASVVDPELGTPQGANEFYNFMQGRIGLTGDFFVDPITGLETTFTLTGDPVAGTGWIDGIQIGPSDRRIGPASGPFNMAPGDTQEVVVAEICAGAIPGMDFKSAITLLKFYDLAAQNAFDNFFDLPKPPPRPAVNVVELDKKIILDWGEDPVSVSSTEDFFEKGYSFQGYNVYQLPNASADVSSGKRLATFDVIDGVKRIIELDFDPNTAVILPTVKQFGDDTGIQRFLEITKDEFNGGNPLINGIKYYFAVTAYSYTFDSTKVPNNVENPISIITVIPQSKAPGLVNGAEYADTLDTEHFRIDPDKPISDGNVFPLVVDPTLLTGQKYEVSFESLGDTLPVWNVDRIDAQGNKVRVLENIVNQEADGESPIIDGIQIRVQGAPLDVKAFDITDNGNGPVVGGDQFASYEVTVAPEDKGISADWYRDVLLSPNGGALGVNTPMQAGGGYYFCVAGGPSIASHEAAIGRWTRGGIHWPILIPNNYEVRWVGDKTTPAGKAWMAFTTGSLVDVPFELWYLGPNLDDPSDDTRMMPWLFDDNGNDVFDFKLDHGASGGDNDPYTDWIYFYMPNDNPQPGEQDYLDLVAAMTPDPENWPGDVEVENFARFVIMNWNQHQGDGGEDVWPDPGTVFRLRMTIPNSPNDRFVFTAPAASQDNNLARTQVDEINVFPNPYYGVNSEEVNKYQRFVTFSHLPEKATIRIFNLAGVLVKTIVKDESGQYQRWDLANDAGLPVASGLYIAYIELPDLGETKILKIAVVQEQQILDRF